MRHGHVRRESLLYVVVTTTRPRYCGVLVAAMVWLTALVVCAQTAAAAQKRKRPPAPPFAVLFPLDGAWLVTLPATPSRPAARDGVRVIVPLSSGNLVALNWDSGSTVWSVPFRATTPPVAAGGIVYVGTGDTLQALDAATGSSLWTGHVAGTLEVLAVSANRLLAVGAGFAHAFDAASGRELWARALPPAGEATGLAASATTLYAAHGDGRVIALAIADGRELWVRPIEGRPSPPLLVEDSLYVGSAGNRFYSLDARNGQPRWTWRTGGDVTGAAAGAKAVYYTSLDAVVRAVNPGNGHQRWKRDLGTRSPVGPVARDGTVLVTGLSILWALEPLTAYPWGSLELPGEVSGTPLVTDVLTPRRVAVVVVLKDGRAIGLRALALQLNEAAPEALPALPGQPLLRDRLPAPPVNAPSGTGR
jgi:eukaryotic-like serine/threonine-protein kinase